MLIFVIPLVSPQLASSWERICKLYARTVKSVCNQTSSNFRIIVVCNEIPEITFSHPHISYVKVDFLPEGSDSVAKTFDRGRKVFTGLKVAQKLKPSHIMFVDADDCVNQYLAEFVEQYPFCNGWFIRQGYIYKEGSNLIYYRYDFFDICGSCNIINTNLYELNYPDENFFLHYYGGHKYITECLNSQGINIKPLPFKGAVYTVENGENYYKNTFKLLTWPNKKFNQLKSLRHYRLLTNSLRRDFGLYDIQHESN